MQFEPNKLYHIYNRGNNREKIFFKPDNYAYFIDKMKQFILPHASIISWCLMPNHFHWMIYTKNKLKPNEPNNSIGILLRSYTRAIQKQENRTGSLFQKGTKAKLLESKHDGWITYAETCFHYIHQNPLKAGLIKRLEDWPFNSFNEYLGKSTFDVADVNLGYELLDISANQKEFLQRSYEVIPEGKIEGLL